MVPIIHNLVTKPNYCPGADKKYHCPIKKQKTKNVNVELSFTESIIKKMSKLCSIIVKDISDNRFYTCVNLDRFTMFLYPKCCFPLT